jgi:hypothetical protein
MTHLSHDMGIPVTFQISTSALQTRLAFSETTLLFWAVALVVVFEFARFGSGVPVVVVRLEMATRDPRFQAEQ